MRSCQWTPCRLLVCFCALQTLGAHKVPPVEKQQNVPPFLDLERDQASKDLSQLQSLSSGHSAFVREQSPVTRIGAVQRKLTAQLGSDDEAKPHEEKTYNEKDISRVVTRSQRIEEQQDLENVASDSLNPDIKRLKSQNPDVRRSQQLHEAKKIENPGARRENDGAPVGRPPDIHTGTVLLLTVLMGGASGIGALPFFFVGSLSKTWAALANAVACGVMLACSFDLMHEGQPYGGGLVVLGILAGALFISASQQWLDQFEDVRFQGLQGLNARKMLLVIGIMAAHAFGEGAGVGVSFCGSRGWAQGVLVTLAIGLHNVPEGLAVATVLVAKGLPPRNALLWTLFTSMPQPLVAVPSFLFVDTFRVLLPVALGFAAGCMLWMVFAELLPDALADAPHGKVATVGTFSAAWLEGLRMMLATLEGGNGSLAVPDAVHSAVLSPALSLVLPAAFSGALGGQISSWLAREKSAGLGVAAGIFAWQGAAELSYSLVRGNDKGLASTAAAAGTGSFVVFLLWRSHSLWSPGMV